MTENKRTIKPATPKQSVLICLIAMLVTLVIPFGFSIGDAVFKLFEDDIVEKECTIVDIYTVTEVRHTDMYTVFRDDSGNEYTKRTTVKDRVGEKVTLSTSGVSAYRNGLELMRPSDFPTWTFCLMPVFFFLAVIYYIFKAFRVGLNGSRGSAQPEYQ